MEAAGVDQVKRGRRPMPTWLATAPTSDRTSAASEVWWRRRESNPRPKARRRGTLHACPLRDCQARRVETAKYRQALASENLAATRRGAEWPPACLMAFDPQPPG